VAAVFDQEAAAMGDPTVIMGDVATIDGFSQRLRHAHRRGYGAAYDRTIRRVGRHAVHYGTNGREFVRNWEQGYYGSLGHGGHVAPPGMAAGHWSPDLNDAYHVQIGSFWKDALRETVLPIESLKFAARGGKALARSKAVGTTLGGVAVVFPAVGAPALAAWGAAHTAMAMYDAHRRGHPTQYPQLRVNIAALGQSDSPLARTLFAALASVPGDINETLANADALLRQAQANEQGAENQTYRVGIQPSFRAGYVGVPMPTAPTRFMPTAPTRLMPTAPTRLMPTAPSPSRPAPPPPVAYSNWRPAP